MTKQEEKTSKENSKEKPEEPLMSRIPEHVASDGKRVAHHVTMKGKQTVRNAVKDGKKVAKHAAEDGRKLAKELRSKAGR